VLTKFLQSSPRRSEDYEHHLRKRKSAEMGGGYNAYWFGITPKARREREEGDF